MNSTTPISSLTETIIMLLEDKQSGRKPMSELNEDIISDVIGSVKTIQKRSEGLYDFVNEYRKLTKVPPPRIEQQNVQELFDEVITLMQASIKENQIIISVIIEPADLHIPMDPNLIEQVLINLIKNSIEALENRNNPSIVLEARASNDHTYISVVDNGPGIDTDLIKEVFVPFYSTKEQGSGIGLSLSRQIMNRHGGTININSQVGNGFSVRLVF
jgi:signal transduction histidine kinase